MKQIERVSIGHVILDGLTAATLVVMFGGVEYLKRGFFLEGMPLILIMILNLMEITLGIAFIIAFVGWLKKLISELRLFFGSAPPLPKVGGIPKAFLEESFREAWRIGATTGVLVFVGLIVIYLWR